MARGEPQGPPAEGQATGKSLGSILTGLGSLAGFAIAFFWLVGNAYSETVLYNYGIPSRLLDKSIYTSAEVGFKIFWKTTGTGLLIGLGLAIALLLFLLLVGPGMSMQRAVLKLQRSGAGRRAGGIRRFLASPLGVLAVILLVGLPLLNWVPSAIARSAARAYVMESREALASCAANQPPCSRYSWQNGSAIGIELTSDGHSIFILSPTGVTRIPNDGVFSIMPLGTSVETIGTAPAPSATADVMSPPISATPPPRPISVPRAIPDLRPPDLGQRVTPRVFPRRGPGVSAWRAAEAARHGNPAPPPAAARVPSNAPAQPVFRAQPPVHPPPQQGR